MDKEDLESPAWHEAALEETAQRFADGDEEALDWEQAKTELRRMKQLLAGVVRPAASHPGHLPFRMGEGGVATVVVA